MNHHTILSLGVSRGASDIHLAVGRHPILRIDGILQPQTDLPMVKLGDIDTLLERVATEAQRRKFNEEGDVDFSFNYDGATRFRANAFQTITGPSLALRRIPSEVPTLEQLGAPDILKDFAHLPRGLVLVTGPTGSGKSTTLAGIVGEIDESSPRHIVTIEDPIEYVHRGRRALINQREVGASAPSFHRALVAAMREDPDVILLGEMRDLETISMALTAAETGHLVLATLHTVSAAKAVDRIIDVFPTGDKPLVRAMLATSLRAVIAQALLPRVGGGRVAALEILVATHAIRNLIREGQTPQIESMIQLGSKHGMVSMRDALNKLVSSGQVDRMDADWVLGQLAEEREEPNRRGFG